MARPTSTLPGVVEQPPARGPGPTVGDPAVLDLPHESAELGVDRGGRNRLAPAASAGPPAAEEPRAERQQEGDGPGERLAEDAAGRATRAPGPASRGKPAGLGRGAGSIAEARAARARCQRRSRTPACPRALSNCPGGVGRPRPSPRRGARPRPRRARPTRARRGGRRRLSVCGADAQALHEARRHALRRAAGRPPRWRSTRSRPPSSRRGTRPADRPPRKRPGGERVAVVRPAGGAPSPRPGRAGPACRASSCASATTRGSRRGGRARLASRSSSLGRGPASRGGRREPGRAGRAP